jgi:hypothetical protein
MLIALSREIEKNNFKCQNPNAKKTLSIEGGYVFDFALLFSKNETPIEDNQNPGDDAVICILMKPETILPPLKTRGDEKAGSYFPPQSSRSPAHCLEAKQTTIIYPVMLKPDLFLSLF